MINNATAETDPKIYPEGGTIKVYARTTDCVCRRFAVRRTTEGGFPKKIWLVLSVRKYYDSRVIGMKNAADPEVLKRK